MQILKRKINLEKEDLADKEVQFAYNSSGHMTIRVFDRENQNEDIVIVLDAAKTRKLIDFVRKISW